MRVVPWAVVKPGKEKEPKKKQFDVPTLVKNLSSLKPGVKEEAVRELRRLAQKGQNINTKELNTVKLLSDLVRDADEIPEVRKNALEALGYAAQNRQIAYDEVAVLLGEVIKVAADYGTVTDLEREAFNQLVAFIRSGYNPLQWHIVQDGVIEALKRANPEFRALAFQLLETAVEKGQNISRGVEEQLMRMAEGDIWCFPLREENEVKTKARDLLLFYYLKRDDYKKVEELKNKFRLGTILKKIKKKKR